MKIAPKEKQLRFIRETLKSFERINFPLYEKIIRNYSSVIWLDWDKEVQLAEDVTDIEVHHFNVFLQTFNIGFIADLIPLEDILK
jgi:hypothetical protein